MSEKQLLLKFHGKIIDHLGIQMYQSPVAAIAEIISNSWDADAEKVCVQLPDKVNSPESTIIIQDDGIGMTFEDCQERFLKVGYNRRSNNPKSKSQDKQRPVLGRKGIGKFAGFGIAEIIEIDTTSQSNGERTKFELNINDLRQDDDYV